MSQSQKYQHGTSLFAANAVPARTFRALTGDVDVDICIVGAGVAGLTAARVLARRGWSVAVLERGTVGSSHSAPHIGLVASGFSESIDRIVGRVGVERARQLWGLSAGGVEQVRATLAETGMEGVAPGVGELIVQAADDSETARTRAGQLRYFGADAEAWPIERVRAELGSSRFFQAVHRGDAFHVHPLNYLHGLAAAAEQAGVRIFENARALSVDIDGVRKRVQTEAGQVRSATIVLAAGSGNGALHPALTGTTITLARHVAATAPCEGLAAALPFAGVVSSDDAKGALFRREGDRLVWASPLAASTSPPWAFAMRARRQIARISHVLRAVPVTHTWTVTATYAALGMPQVAELAPSVWLAGAFGDQGIGNAAMAGDLIAHAICDGDDRWRLFSTFGLAWPGGLLGRAAARVMLPAGRAQAGLGRLAAHLRSSKPESAAITATVPVALLPPPAPESLTAVPAEAAPVAPAAPPTETMSKKRAPRAPRRKATSEAGAAPRRRASGPKPADVLKPKRASRAKSLPKPAAVPSPAAKPNGHSHGDEPTN